jgi:PAS domain-containing protein/CheY-like chemotaxis protein
VFFRDLVFTLLLPLPPWVGFQLFKRKGRVGLSYGYFLGGIVCVLALPWAALTGLPAPTAHLGGSLLGFTLFLQALREGAQGLRRLAVGLGGATVFMLVLLTLLSLPLESLVVFWAVALVQALMWLLLSDLAYLLTRGRWLHVRMPLVGAGAMAIVTLGLRFLHTAQPHGHILAAMTGGMLLGFVALEQLLWLRQKGTWVEGRGEGLRSALTLLDQGPPVAAPSLSLVPEAKQPLFLINEKGRFLEVNGPFSAMVGMPRHTLRGYAVESLLQGDSRPVWDDLKDQLVRQGFARARATLVGKDGTFEEVDLEAVGFDFNLVFGWVSEARTGALAIRGEAGCAVLSGGMDASSSQALVNALGAIIPAADQIIAEASTEPVRELGRLVLKAAQRLRPLATAGDSATEILDSRAAVEALKPYLQRVLPPEVEFRHRTALLPLSVSQESLQRVATHLAMHGRQALQHGSVTLVMEQALIGGRVWALWRVEVEGAMEAPPREVLGLAWLLQSVRQTRGMLACARDIHGGIWPKVYLPVDAPLVAAPPRPLLDKTIWIMDRDPLVREALTVLIHQEGGSVEAFATLRDLLKRSRDAAPPSLLALERQPQLERFQSALRKLSRDPIPALVLGSGQALPLDPAAFGIHQVGFLDKPFPSQDFIQSLLALLPSAAPVGS